MATCSFEGRSNIQDCCTISGACRVLSNHSRTSTKMKTATTTSYVSSHFTRSQPVTQGLQKPGAVLPNFSPANLWLSRALVDVCTVFKAAFMRVVSPGLLKVGGASYY